MLMNSWELTLVWIVVSPKKLFKPPDVVDLVAFSAISEHVSQQFIDFLSKQPPIGQKIAEDSNEMDVDLWYLDHCSHFTRLDRREGQLFAGSDLTILLQDLNLNNSRRAAWHVTTRKLIKTRRKQDRKSEIKSLKSEVNLSPSDRDIFFSQLLTGLAYRCLSLLWEWSLQICSHISVWKKLSGCTALKTDWKSSSSLISGS